MQEGTTQFWNGVNTTTYGINGAHLAPTIIVSKGDSITLNVTNNLTGNGNSTTMHWHGLHVAPENDGGPHQLINQGTTWSPSFKIRNDAGTYWYHPHGHNKTERHVSKGLAGMFIVKDPVEGAMALPRTYGVDDIPIIIQSKAFDVLNQIAIATQEDTLICVNGTPHAYFNAPAQVIRLRMLNGSSLRSYNIGFSNNMNFQIIASDGGLLDAPVTVNRVLIAPGERYEILVDLQTYLNNTVYLMSYSSTMPNNIYGAGTVQSMGGGVIQDYNLNPLNGTDFNILQINVVAQTATPVLTIPTSLITNNPLDISSIDNSRTIELRSDSMGMGAHMVQGPFNIDGEKFEMESVNQIVHLNDVEKWRIRNMTDIAHPFHIHDVEFYILNVNGGATPPHLRGKKDVVLVLPHQYVEFITKFETFANSEIPYMYHCHLLHHEDDGMMGSFLVIDPNAPTGVTDPVRNISLKIYPNPSKYSWQIETFSDEPIQYYRLYTLEGKLIEEKQINQAQFTISNNTLAASTYLITVSTKTKSQTFKLIKQ